MTRLQWSNVRNKIIIASLAGAAGICLAIILTWPLRSSPKGKYQNAFAQDLPTWQLVEGQDFELLTHAEDTLYPEQWRGIYQTSSANTLINAYFVYTPIAHLMDSSRLQYASEQFKALTLQETIEIPGVGYAGLFENDTTVQLATCINPAGKSSFTAQQHVQQRAKQLENTRHIALAIIGLNDFRDWRCLWVQASIQKSEVLTTEAAILLLINFWQEFHYFGVHNFPRA